MNPQLRFLEVPGPASKQAAQRRLAWWEWNATGVEHPNHVVVCGHGLTRQSRDFDVLAQALASKAMVVCVDVAGRGHSDWLADPMAYQVPTYALDLSVLLGHLRQRHAAAAGAAEPYALTIDWVGTSMGGLIGMAVASQPAMGIRRLVLNDVGPVIEPQALSRIADYVGQQPVFATEQAAADALWTILKGFGPHTPEQWLALSRPMLRPTLGGWTFHYDPDIALPFKALAAMEGTAEADEARQAGEALMWQVYEHISAQTLVLRGAESDLLGHTTALAMTQRGPCAQLVEFEGVGHAPSLVSPDQVRVVQDFLA
jgi:pimeloyl-ACP methyl ester carboxylesterase